MLRGSLESRDKDVEELRIEVSRQSDHYDDLCLVYEILLEKAQKLRSDIITLRSSVRRDRWRMARGENGTLRVLALGSEGWVISLGE